MSALVSEATALGAALDDLVDSDWDRCTRCEPWTVGELVGHVLVVLSRVVPMVEAPSPSGTPIPTADYFRPDDRFSSESNRQRVQSGIDQAATVGTGPAAIDAVRHTVLTLDEICRDQPLDRLVLTRHDDVMTLDEFLLTRVVEVVLHGIDVADALGRAPWTTPAAGELVIGLLAGPAADEVNALPWDTPTILRSATGREAPYGPPAGLFGQLGIRWLALG